MTYDDLDAKTREDYADLDLVSKRFSLEIDHNGVLRFKANKAVQFAMNTLCTIGHARRAGLNEMFISAQREHWPVEELRTFYRMSGYSLCGFMDIFGDKGDGTL